MSDPVRSSFDLTYGCGRSVETCRRRSEHVVVSVFNQPAAHVAMTVGVRAWLIEGRRPPEDGPVQPASQSTGESKHNACAPSRYELGPL